MKVKYLALLILVIVLGGAVQAATPNWLLEFIILRSPQTKVVRHPVDRGKYYLCWREGTNRYGIYFRRSNFDSKLRLLQPGKMVALPSMLTVNQSGWTAADEKICWGSQV